MRNCSKDRVAAGASDRTRGIATFLLVAILCGVLWPRSWAAEGVVRISVDLNRTNGPFRLVHGVNKGPLAEGGTIDLTESYRKANIPFIRLHDCQWPYPDIVDIHAIFRNFSADARQPGNYDFALTDEYMAAVQRTGAKVIYRLGESIEHMQTKRFVHPPADPKQWAEICLGVIRHYNDGWASGFRYALEYFEIWNEPENRPAMWTGSDEQFLELYSVAALRIKQAFPNVKVGGPGFGFSGKLENGMFKPSAFVLRFLEHCRSNNVPLDFLSWHCYTADPSEIMARARGIRDVLNAHGFQNTENHLTEWNFLPENSWEPFSKRASPELRKTFYHRMSGQEGAAVVAAVMIGLQSAPVDVSCLYHGEIGPFGLFDEFGGETAAYRAVSLFNELVGLCPVRLTTASQPAHNLWFTAGTSRLGAAAALLSNADPVEHAVELQLQGLHSSLPIVRIKALAQSGYATSSPKGVNDGVIRVSLPAHGVALITAGKESP